MVYVHTETAQCSEGIVVGTSYLTKNVGNYRPSEGKGYLCSALATVDLTGNGPHVHNIQ